jgi:Ca-activated chloride channel family protein
MRRDTPGVKIQPDKIITVNVELALVNVTVTDPYDRLVLGLEPHNFRVFEDGVEQEITSFSSEDVPVSVGVVFDLSYSMARKIDISRAAILEFFKAANPQDEFFIVGFSDHAELMSTFSTDLGHLRSCISSATPEGRTALLDAVYLALRYMDEAKYKRHALLIFSDGGDNHSRHSEKEIRKFVREADTELYAIGFYDPLSYPYRSPEEIHGPSLLSEITEITGGKAFPVEHLEDLAAIAAKIGAELRNQYVLGYTPSNHVYDGQRRKIKVTIRPPNGAPPLLAHAKSGYYANAR